MQFITSILSASLGNSLALAEKVSQHAVDKSMSIFTSLVSCSSNSSRRCSSSSIIDCKYSRLRDPRTRNLLKMESSSSDATKVEKPRWPECFVGGCLMVSMSVLRPNKGETMQRRVCDDMYSFPFFHHPILNPLQDLQLVADRVALGNFTSSRDGREIRSS